MKLSQTQLAVLALIVANIIWGAASPIFKWTLQDIQPFVLAFIRFSLAALLILPFTIKKLKIDRQDLPILLFTGIVGLGFHIGYYFYGLKLSASINQPIIDSAGPILLIVGAVFFLHEKPKGKVIKGTVLSLIGVLIVVAQPLFGKSGDNSLLGNGFFIISTILAVAYDLMLKKLTGKYSPLTLVFWIFVITAATFLPFVAIEASQKAPLMTLDLKTMTGIVFGVVLCSGVAYCLHTFGLKHIAANEIGIFSYVDPFAAILIAQPLLGETISLPFLIGSIFVFLGIFVAEGRLHYHPIHLLRPKPQKVEPEFAYKA